MARVIAVEARSQGLGQRSTQQTTESLLENTSSQSLARQEQSVREGQRILRETASSVAQAGVQEAQAGGAGTSVFGGLINTAVQLGDRFATIQGRHLERERKEAEAREKALAEQAKAEREARRQAQLTEVESIGNDLVLAQGENGTTTTMWGLRQVINDPKFEDITDEDRREMERRFQSAIRRNQDEIVQKVERTQDKTNRANFKAIEAEQLFVAGGQLSQLKYENDPAKQAQVVRDMLATADARALENNLSELDRLNLRSTLLEAASKSTNLANTTLAEVNDEREQLSAAFAEVQKLTVQRAQGLPPDAYQAALADVYAKYPAARGYELPTIENTQQQALDQASFTSKMRRLAKDNYEFENELPVLSNQVIAAQALEIVTDPSARVKFELFDTGDNARVLQLAPVLQGYKEDLNRLSTGTELRKLDADAKAALTKIQAIERYRANPSLLEDVQAIPGSTPPNITDEAYQQAQLDYQTAITEYRSRVGEISRIQQELAKYGVVYDQASGQLGLDANVQAEVEQVRQMPVTSSDPPGTGQGSGFDPNSPFSGFGVGPGFNGAGGTIAPTYQPVTNGQVKGKQGTVKLVNRLDSVFKGHLIDNTPVGSYDFTFIDQNDSDITALPAPFSGVVTEAGTRGGYGYVVALQDPSTGQEWFMAHLNEPTHLRVGQSVVAGQRIGIQGSSGNSTGPHVHLEIYDRPYAEGGTRITNRSVTRPLVDQYFNRATTGNWPSTVSPSLGLPPNQGLGRLPAPFTSGNVPTFQPQTSEPTPPGGITLPGGGYILQGQLYLPGVTKVEPAKGSQFSTSRPLTMPSTSRNRRDFPERNDPRANYGYATLKDDDAFRNALTGVADRLDIPAQWLADIMAFESFYDGKPHNPRARNAEGAVGLIQFYPGSGLTEVAREMGVSDAEASRRLLNMSAAQQMKYVESHIRRELRYAKAAGWKGDKITRLEDLFAVIFGGHGLLLRPDSERGGVGDGNITYQGYLARIGEHVGRSYVTGRGGQATHTSMHSGCPVCQQMMATQGYITPHAAPR
jgi:hypothetical protein